MNLGIVGSRTFKDFKYLEKTILNLIDLKDIIYIVSGGADGTDALAEEFASKYNINCKIFYADWKMYGKKAGYIRNHSIVAMSDIIVAFWDGKSKGTNHTITIAKERRKKIYVIEYNNIQFKGELND